MLHPPPNKGMNTAAKILVHFYACYARRYTL